MSCLLSALAALTVSASSLDGVTYTSRQLELVKRVTAQRSVIYPGYVPDAAASARHEQELHTGLSGLGRQLDTLLLELRRDGSPYPLLRGRLLDYAALRPGEEGPERGRIYTMYVGELGWPFPAPLLADLVRLRVAYEFPLPLRELLTTALFRWGRDHVDRAERLGDAAQRDRVKQLLDALADGGVLKSGWRHDSTVRDLLGLSLAPAEIARLAALAEKGPVKVRAASLKVLGVGGHLADPALYARALADPEPEVRHAAFWALLFVPGRAALPHLQGYAERSHAIAARMKEVLPVITNEQVAAETAAFDRALASLTGASGTPPAPYSGSPAPPAPAAPPTPPPADDPGPEAPPWTVRVSDGSGNTTILSHAEEEPVPRWRYEPVTKARSSSGTYSGGRPASGELLWADVEELWRLLRALAPAVAAPEPAPPRAMGTTLVSITTAAGEQSFVLPAGATGPAADLGDLMTSLRER